ncbi:hypothetical protein [Antiquaquibacter soli]|uniref:Uncharacterized protein n=1 Tax=Antiquaquibacter soli TaxID=3064523 RepID=A0ABT9BTG3_9MICO|nr:hypothetical protein [Protaetiibacter sp. WY-16]MDO7883091.1 hypothetical protein [Protaetiibacter sp. WY-16]
MNVTNNSLRATLLFAATSIVAAIVVGAMLVSGWGGGILDNRVEWVYWAGAIFGAVGIGLLGAATVAPERASGRLTVAGVALFLVAPVLCVVAVFTDYWI